MLYHKNMSSLEIEDVWSSARSTLISRSRWVG
jgi:hypothetical protein